MKVAEFYWLYISPIRGSGTGWARTLLTLIYPPWIKWGGEPVNVVNKTVRNRNRSSCFNEPLKGNQNSWRIGQNGQW